jgi:hypothetical protein
VHPSPGSKGRTPVALVVALIEAPLPISSARTAIWLVLFRDLVGRHFEGLWYEKSRAYAEIPSQDADVPGIEPAATRENLR